MLNRNQTTISPRINSWLSPVRDLKSPDFSKFPTNSSRSIQSPSPRAEILGQVRESIISHIKHQNVCLENKIKMREQLQKSQGSTTRESIQISTNNTQIASTKNHIHSNSRSPANTKSMNFRFDSIGFMEKIMKKEPVVEKKQEKSLDEVQFAMLDEVFFKVRELFEEFNRKEKAWKWEKSQMTKKIEFLEQRVKNLERRPFE